MEVAIIEDKKSVSTVTEDYKAIAIKWLTSTGNLNKFSENEKNQFIDICMAYGLNPIKKQVYGIKYGDKFNIIVGYESYIQRAEASGRLEGWNVTYNAAEEKAVITIHRKDWENPFIHEVYMSEYNDKKSLWDSKPITMLKKVAIAQGFRMCFTEILGGIPYTSEELPEEMTNPSANEKIITPIIETHTKKLDEKKSKYTKEQASELGSIVNTKYDDGSFVFTEDEKGIYRTMLIDGRFDEAKEKATEIAQDRIAKMMADAIDMAFGE